MNKLFREKKVNKIYWAIVETLPPMDVGIIENYLKKNEKEINHSFQIRMKENLHH